MSADADGDPLPDFARHFFDELQESGLPQIERATVALLGIQNDRIVHDRTGVLYRCADRHFILTASHDLLEIVKHEIPLYVSLNAENRIPIPLAGARFLSTEIEGRDVAAILLPPSSAADICAHREFLSHNRIRLDGCDGKALYMLAGYPMAWSAQVVAERTVLSRCLMFSGRQYQGERNPDVVFYPQIHFLMEFNREVIHIADGAHESLPEPYGISGCGIWRICDWSKRGLENWTPSQVSLAAIQHSWCRRQEYVTGTRIAFVLDRILAEYPELGPAMKLVYFR